MTPKCKLRAQPLAATLVAASSQNDRRPCPTNSMLFSAPRNRVSIPAQGVCAGAPGATTATRGPWRPAQMFRRDFVKSSLALTALATRNERGFPSPSPLNTLDAFPKAPGLTQYVSEFIVNTHYEDVPKDVLALGRKSHARRFRPGPRRIGIGRGSLGPRIREIARSLRRRQPSQHHRHQHESSPALRRLCQRCCNSRRRFRRHPAFRGQGPRLRPAHASHRRRPPARLRALRTRTPQRKGPHDRLSSRRRGRMQDRRSHFSPPLQRRLPHHRHQSARLAAPPPAPSCVA